MVNTSSAVPSARRYVPALAVAAVALLAYGLTLGHELVWDDLKIIPHVERLVDEGGIPRLLAAEFDIDGPTGYYRPVVLLSMWADSRLQTLITTAFHLTNVILHVVNSVLVLLLLRSLALGGTAALGGALLFAVHPVHVESVAFVSGRTDLWATTFVLASTLAWLASRRRPPTPLKPLIALSAGAVSLLLGALAKEVALMLPAVLLTWDAVKGLTPCPVEESWWRRNRGWLASWALAVGVVLALRWILVGGTLETELAGGGTARSSGFWSGSGLVPAIVANNLRLLIIPWPLRPHYTPSQLSLGPVVLLASLALLGAAVALAGKSRGRSGLLALAWIFGFLFPVSGVLPVSGAPLAERFLYLPSIGVSLLAAAFLNRPWSSKRTGLIVAGLLLPLLLTGTVLQGRIWKSEVTLMESIVRRSPASPEARFRLARTYLGAQRANDAVAQYREVLRLAPRFPRAALELGSALNRLGRKAEALAAFEQAFSIDPLDVATLNNLGIAWAERGDFGRASTFFGRALSLQPGRSDIRLNLALSRLQAGASGEALKVARQIIRAEPTNARAQYLAGLALLTMGDQEGALAVQIILARLDTALAADLLAQIDSRLSGP